jgi:hypothetical protein
VLGRDVMSNHSTPDIGSRCPWTPKHFSRRSVPPICIPWLAPVRCIQHWIWTKAWTGASRPCHRHQLMLPVRRASTLKPLAVRASLAMVPCRCAGLTRSKSWSQTSGTIGTLRHQRRSRVLCGGSVPTAVDEGIEADVRFVQLASEPTSQGLDRRRTGHYWRRAGVGSPRKTVYSRTSSRSSAE